MNILFISGLYPSRPKGTGEEITLALHHLVAKWAQTENILVIRPEFIYLRELFKKPETAVYTLRDSAGKGDSVSGSAVPDSMEPGKNGFSRRLFRRFLSRFRPRYMVMDGVSIVVYPILKIPRLMYLYAPLYRFLDRYGRIRRFVPDIVVAHYDKSLTIGYRYSRRRNLPLVVGIHAAPDLLTDDPSAFTRRCGPLLDAARLIACRSAFLCKRIHRWFPHYREKSFIAISGIEEKYIGDVDRAIAKMKRWKQNSPPEPVSLITVCRLSKVKKIHTNLEALARVDASINWTYTLIGGGEERSNLENRARQLGIRDRVFFKGAKHRSEVMEELKQSHVFVMVSVLESFGLVYLEAMATGNLVIGAYGEGIDGILRHRENGFLSPAGESEPLKELFEEIILHTDGETLEAILHRSNRTIREYTDTVAARRYLNKLKEFRP